MGAVLDSSNEMVPEEEQVHLVVLTEDYYVSVYETTQKQGLDVTGVNSSTTRGDTNPMTNVSLGELRGTWYTDTGAYGYCWPQDGHAVAPNSAIGRLRELTGLDDFDLPTEAQWEYACRAGERFMFANGKNGTVWDPRAICICSGDPKGYTVPQPVGSVAPNDWGIYDMQGNVQELCLDRYATGEVREATFATGWKGGVATVDPVGAREWMGEDHALQYIIRRGGHVGLTWSKCTASYNHESGNWWWNGSGFIGFRLVRPAVAK